MNETHRLQGQQGFAAEQGLCQLRAPDELA